MTGRRAFGEGTPVERAYAILKDDPPAPTKVNPEISPALELVVRRCLEKSPEERFQSARDLAFHLQSISTTSGHGGSSSLVTSLPPRRVPRGALVGAAIAAAVAVGNPGLRARTARPRRSVPRRDARACRSDAPGAAPLHPAHLP